MIIFDLDQTLVDTSSVQQLRKDRNWSAVRRQIPKLPVYPGIHDLLKELHKSGEVIAIVTKSPDSIAKEFIRIHKWPIEDEHVIGYHQVVNRKPHPEGLNKAMQVVQALPEDTYHVGDHPDDTQASRSAGVQAIGAAWGIDDASDLKNSKPDHLFSSVAELRDHLMREIKGRAKSRTSGK